MSEAQAGRERFAIALMIMLLAVMVGFLFLKLDVQQNEIKEILLNKTLFLKYLSISGTI